MSLDREAFLKPREVETREVEVDGLGVVRIRKLTKGQLCDFQMWISPKGVRDEERYARRDLKLITMAVVGEDNEPFLTEEDMDTLAGQPGRELDDLAYDVMVLNGYMVRVETDELLGKSDN